MSPSRGEEHVPAESVGVSVRDVATASALADSGVRVRAGDFTSPATLEHAFEGATRVLVVSAAIRGAGAVAANVAAIEAARTAGAGRILYTSHQATSLESVFAPAVAHAQTEEVLIAQGVSFTSLRNGFYASTLAMHVDGALRTGQLVAPEDGPVSWTGHDDLAEAAALALLEDRRLDGITAPLTAPQLLDLEQVAEFLGELTGKSIVRVVAADDDWKAAMVDRGMPAGVADFTLGLFRAARQGEFAVADPALEALLGRPATSARQVLAGLVTAR